MKGGNIYSFRGTHIFLALVTLVLFTTLTWTWERNPIIAITLRSAQEWYRLPSEFPVEAPIESMGTPTLEKGVEKSVAPSTGNATKLQLDTKVVAADDSIPAESPETQYNQNVTPPSKSKGTPMLEKGAEKSITPIRKNATKPQLDSESMAAVDSMPTESPETRYNQNVMPSSRNKVCNYAKGRWVADSRRPLYSGFNCKQWLSSMWSCRMTQRPDFSFEGYRWQPENCDMQDFDRSAFLIK